MSMADGMQRMVDDLCRQEAEAASRGAGGGLCARCCLLVVLLYLLCVLSLPPHSLLPLMLYALFPPAVSIMLGIRYIIVVRRSLPVLPFVLFVGIFNPLYERAVAYTVSGVNISYGWVSFASLAVRGLLAVQAVILLLSVSGFRGVCSALQSLGVPSLIVGQLQMLHRHLLTVLAEAQSISRAVASRGYGRSSYPPRLWATFIGRLLLRSLDRAERVHRAMLARGFTGSVPCGTDRRWRQRDTVCLLLAASIFLPVRFLICT